MRKIQERGGALSTDFQRWSSAGAALMRHSGSVGPPPPGRGISKCLDRTRLRDYQALGGYADVSPGVAIRVSYANVPDHFGFVYGPIGTGRSRPKGDVRRPAFEPLPSLCEI